MNFNIILILSIIFILFVYLFHVSSIFRIFVYGLFSIFILFLFFKLFVRKYDEPERGIILRFGKFNRVVGPGWAIVIPFIEQEYSKVDIRTHIENINVPDAFTQDEVRLGIDAIIYYKIVDPEKAILKLKDYKSAIVNLVRSELRDLLANYTMEEVFAKGRRINDDLRDRISILARRWGLDVVNLEIRGIRPPERIVDAMTKKEAAVRELEAQKFLAQARKVVIEALGEGAKKLDDRAIAYLYMKALKELAKSQGTAMILPSSFVTASKEIEASGLLMGMGLSEAINKIKEKIKSK